VRQHRSTIAVEQLHGRSVFQDLASNELVDGRAIVRALQASATVHQPLAILSSIM